MNREVRGSSMVPSWFPLASRCGGTVLTELQVHVDVASKQEVLSAMMGVLGLNRVSLR